MTDPAKLESLVLLKENGMEVTEIFRLHYTVQISVMYQMKKCKLSSEVSAREAVVLLGFCNQICFLFMHQQKTLQSQHCERNAKLLMALNCIARRAKLLPTEQGSFCSIGLDTRGVRATSHCCVAGRRAYEEYLRQSIQTFAWR